MNKPKTDVRKDGGYQGNKSVNPNAIKLPQSGSAVRPPATPKPNTPPPPKK